MNFNIIGAGRLGKNIALALSASGLGTLLAVCNQSKASAETCCAQLGFGMAVAHAHDLPLADVLWIACNDDAIPAVMDQLVNCSFNSGTLVIHCSGVLSSSVLSPLKDKGCLIASFHPMKPFPATYLSKEAFQGVECVIEGDTAACSWLKSTFEALQAQVNTIHPSAKATYHAAACLIANYLVTLSASGEELLLESGISAAQAQEVIIGLIQSTLDNLKQKQPSAASLTGPLLRGDVNTLAMHLAAIDNPIIKNLYKAAGLATLPHTQLSHEKRQQIQFLLK